MKKLLPLTLLLAFLPFVTLSQPCLPEGINFTTQAQIDSFQIIYPNCTEIEGDVEINGDDITNLNSLNVLTSIGGHLGIYDNDALISITGLDNVTSIGGELAICNNADLTSLSGLENMTSIGGGLSVFSNGALTSLLGLDNVTSIGGRLYIANTALTSISSLNNVTSIGGELIIRFNHALTSLTGIGNINSGSIDSLYIYFNNYLSTCDVQSICDYLSAPGGTIEIYDNASGCNNQEEVEAACDTLSLQEIYFDIEFSLSPNPFTSTTTLSYTLDKPENVHITIYNLQGQIVERMQIKQTKGQQKVQWIAEGLPAGLYIIRLQAGNDIAVRKLIVVE